MHTSDNVSTENLERWQGRLKEMPWSHGDPAAAWDHVLRTRQEEPDDDDQRKLKTAADAFADHITRDIPWTEAAWQEYVERSMAWHDEYPAAVSDAMVRNRPMLNFPHPGAEIQLGDLTARPVTDSYSLADAGREMGNALSWWAEPCATGRSLIYTIHRTGQTEIEAAMELTGDPGHREVRQVEGPRFRRATPEQSAIASHAANLLNASQA